MKVSMFRTLMATGVAWVCLVILNAQTLNLYMNAWISVFMGLLTLLARIGDVLNIVRLTCSIFVGVAVLVMLSPPSGSVEQIKAAILGAMIGAGLGLLINRSCAKQDEGDCD
ncbi:MAG: hypothetical protein ACI87E_001784 [Mariniblastus sp.]|jgi:hypothetical protein